jgi:hypothetical protein|tara:strand:+ start:3830 stop:4093 length:264 start_codon:yes stop_codon:yes gene_type:complete
MDKETRATQLKTVYDVFFNTPMTMKECSTLTGIMRENICWYCRDFRKLNQLFIVGKKICSITKRVGVNIYTTNPKFAPEDKQLHLFQ